MTKKHVSYKHTKPTNAQLFFVASFLSVALISLISVTPFGDRIKQFLAPPVTEAHITEEVTALAIDLTSPQDGQILKPGEAVDIRANVSINGQVHFAAEFETYVNGERICKIDHKRGLDAFRCSWKAPRAKSGGNYAIMVKVFMDNSTGGITATDTANVVVQ